VSKPELVRMQWWINNEYRGYRLVSKKFFQRLQLQKKMDVVVQDVTQLHPIMPWEYENWDKKYNFKESAHKRGKKEKKT